MAETLPKFLRAVTGNNGNHNVNPRPEPVMEAKPHVNPVAAKANDLGNAIADLITERDALQKEIAFLRRHSEALEDKLNRAEHERNHYINRCQYFERFSVSIITNFNAIRMLVDDTQQRAGQAGLDISAPTTLAPIPSPTDEGMAPADDDQQRVAELEEALAKSREGA